MVDMGEDDLNILSTVVFAAIVHVLILSFCLWGQLKGYCNREATNKVATRKLCCNEF